MMSLRPVVISLCVPCSFRELEKAIVTDRIPAEFALSSGPCIRVQYRLRSLRVYEFARPALLGVWLD